MSSFFFNVTFADVPLSEPDAQITRPDDRSAYIVYKPRPEVAGELVSGRFVVQYDVDRAMDGGDLLVGSGVAAYTCIVQLHRVCCTPAKCKHPRLL